MYDSSEISGQVLVTALRSSTRGQRLRPTWFAKVASWDFTVVVDSGDTKDLQLASGRISQDTSDRLIRFSLRRLVPQLKPYQIRLILHGDSQYGAETELYYLPAKNEGSSVKVDNLHGGLLVANNSTGFAYEDFVPIGLSIGCPSQWTSSHHKTSGYKDLGINAVSRTCDPPGQDALYSEMDSADVWYQYSLKFPLLQFSIPRQITLLKDRPNLLSWQVDSTVVHPFTTAEVYALLKEQDPYHPVGIVFSCGETANITSNTDYITESARIPSQDSGPIAAPKPDMPMNVTNGTLRDTADRLDAFSDYFTSLDNYAKPFWANLWTASRVEATTGTSIEAELWTTMVLTLNHNTRAMMAGLDLSDKHLLKAYGSMASAITTPEVSRLLLSGTSSRIDVGNARSLDVGYWKSGSQVLVAFANLDRKRVHDNVSIELPFSAKRIASQPWGSLSWSLRNGTKLETYGLDGLATSILIFDT